ncbi:hypothetical protein BT96DRAFT_1010013 [Gymnopus androsaceus JB14]|uniref:Uncharacterized protein n=1 Tax=Gymnopus androsaceus JB14 TaxID=1447944 RepID=A0A6A4GBN8_9AGAR|nr:hypothetical protein BT96DRAFT_1010013 [Gymnopus androsaceus JB14]
MPFLTLPIDSFPVLAELDLLIFPHKSPHNQKVSAFASSPLQKLSFHCPYSGFFTQSASLGLNKFSFDAAQLTSLYVYDYLIHSLWDFLQGCQNLVQLTVIKLTVISCYEEILVRIDLFGFLTTPALTDLCIDLSESIYANLIGKKIRPKTLLQKLLCKPKAKEALLPHLEFLRFSLDPGSGSSSDLKPSLLLDVVEVSMVGRKLGAVQRERSLSKVQMDKIVERHGDDVTSDELEKEEEESWLTSAMSKTDKKTAGTPAK